MFVEEEVTGRYEGEELADRRADRHPEDRFRHIEKNQDQTRAEITKMSERIGKVEVAVADVGGQMKVIPRLVDAMEKATEALQHRDHVTFTAQVDVEKAQELGEVEVHTAKELGAVEVKTVATKAKWALLTKIAAVLGAIGTAISTMIAARGC